MRLLVDGFTIGMFTGACLMCLAYWINRRK